MIKVRNMTIRTVKTHKWEFKLKTK